MGIAATLGFLLIEPNVKLKGFAELDDALLSQINAKTVILDAEGEEIPYASGKNSGAYVDIEQVPEHTQNAFVAIEDKRFYSHRGVDYLRIIAAAKNNIMARSFAEGASTISQQLIKNTHLKSEKTIFRKVQEIRIARDLERKYSKSEIMEKYLNVLYFGNNIYGIERAAEHYFGKNTEDLSLSESALLAAVINNPTKYDLRKKLQAATKRRNLVLEKMYEQRYITADELIKAKEETVNILPGRKSEIGQYANYVIAEAQNDLMTGKDEIINENYCIKTHCNAELSEFLQNLIENYVKDVDCNVLVQENQTARYIGNCSNVARNLSSERRQPASTIKPILCYAPALELKKVYCITPILDQKTQFGDWSPSNFHDKYFGWVSVKDSLVRSLNMPAIKLLEMNGVENAKRIARKFGLNFTPADDSLAMALGAMNKGLTLPELVDAYATFARGGVYMKGKFISEISDMGKTIRRNIASQSGITAISAENAYLITDMLRECAVNGTARRIASKHKNVAAKTGTFGNADGNSDAYCIAYTPQYTVAVWFGARNNELMPNEYSGGGLPSKLAGKIIEYLGDDSTFRIPQGIVSAEIDNVELKENHKVLLAGVNIEQKNRLTALFSRDNMPKVYSKNQTYLDEWNILDDFYFVIDGRRYG